VRGEAVAARALALALALALAGPARAEGARPLPLPPGDPAAARIAVVVVPDRTRTHLLADAGLRQARRDMIEGAAVAEDDLRALADLGDGLAALRLVQRLATRPAPPQEEIAWYGTLAAQSGRVAGLAPAVAALRLLEPAAMAVPRREAARAMLEAHALAGNTLALDALIDLSGAGRLFGPLPAPLADRILQTGDGRAALRLALARMQEMQEMQEIQRVQGVDPGAGGPADKAAVRRALNHAAAGSDPAVRAMAAALLAGGAGQ